jgi:hypothetical protein
MVKVWKWTLDDLQVNGTMLDAYVTIWQENDTGKTTYNPVKKVWNFSAANPISPEALVTNVRNETVAIEDVIAQKQGIKSMIGIENTLSVS